MDRTSLCRAPGARLAKASRARAARARAAQNARLFQVAAVEAPLDALARRLDLARPRRARRAAYLRPEARYWVGFAWTDEPVDRARAPAPVPRAAAPDAAAGSAAPELAQRAQRAPGTRRARPQNRQRAAGTRKKNRPLLRRAAAWLVPEARPEAKWVWAFLRQKIEMKT